MPWNASLPAARSTSKNARLERELKMVEARLARLLHVLLDGDQTLDTVKAARFHYALIDSR